MTEDKNQAPEQLDRLESIHRSAMDISRWAFDMVRTHRISTDRRMDIIRVAEYIIKLTKGL